jgi:hypothetical protein
LNKQAIYFPHESLTLKPDVPGAKMWGVALERTLLTFFEVEPHCRFDRHNHESEQITMVLEGELFFELDNGTFCVKRGEVITARLQLEPFDRKAMKWTDPLHRYSRSRSTAISADRALHPKILSG